MNRKLFYAFNILCLAVFVAALVVDFDKDWRGYQREYFLKTAASLEARAREAEPQQALALRAQARQMRGQWTQVRQIIARDLGRVDRCITCHVGMDEFANPTLKTPFQEQPFTGHPDVEGLVRAHPFQKFGCTSCHSGQGIATTIPAAHGEVHHWEKPMLRGALIQASCAKCHGNFETLKGAEVVAKGRHLFEEHGCFGCHSIRGFGGVISEPLDAVADKPLERIGGYNFSLIKGPDGKPLDKHHWTLPNWILAHLTNSPMDFIPNDPFAKFNKEPIAPSGMPDFSKELPPGGAEAITAYLLSMTEELIPSRYTVPAPPKAEPKPAGAVERGRRVYRKYGCAGCHGVDAKEGRRNYNAMGPGQGDPASYATPEALHAAMALGREPTLPDTMGTFSPDELRTKIREGVTGAHINRFVTALPGRTGADGKPLPGPMPPLYMPPWKDKIKGDELEDLIAYLFSIKKAEKDEW